MTASDILTFWYLWTAIIAALLVILPGIGKGANGLVRLVRFLHLLAMTPARVASQQKALDEFREEFRRHAQEDLDFQRLIVQTIAPSAAAALEKKRQATP